MENKERIMSAYIAGCMDGDGSISLIKTKASASGNPEYKPLLQLGSLSKDLMNLFVQELGGSFSYTPPKTGKDGIARKGFYRWKLHGRDKCKNAITRIIEFLQIKKERGLILRQFIEECPFIRGSNLLTYQEMEKREGFVLKMKQLNESFRYDQSLSKPGSSFKKEPVYLAYLAGILDTDGSFSIKKENPRRGRVSMAYSPQILLSMTDLQGINFIRKFCSFGTVNRLKAKTARKGFVYRWALRSTNEISELIKELSPYLFVKKDIAQIVLNFCNDFSPVKHRRGRLEGEELNKRENYYKAAIHCNKYGVYKSSLIDLEARQGNKGEGESHAERLNEMGAEEAYAKV